MPSDSRRYGRIVNDFVHDLTTGSWAAGVLVLWMLSARLPGMPAEAAAALRDAMDAVWWLTLGSFIVVNATGGLRMRYWRDDTAPEDMAAKRKALLVKHAVFLLVYGAGTVWAWTLVRTGV